MKDASKTIKIFLILTIFTLIFIFTVGIKILLNSSAFIANFFEKKNSQSLNNEKTEESFYGSLEINNIPTATNEASIIIDGSVVNYDKIYFYINDKKIDELEIFGNDNFSKEINGLKEGDNKVYLKGETKNKKYSKKTNIYNVFYKNTKPKLEVETPQDNSAVFTDEILVKGSTDKEVFVKINDLPIVVDANGNFQTSIKLKEGENKIKIEAVDMASNQEIKNLTVIYQKEWILLFKNKKIIVKIILIKF